MLRIYLGLSMLFLGVLGISQTKRVIIRAVNSVSNLPIENALFQIDNEVWPERSGKNGFAEIEVSGKTSKIYAFHPDYSDGSVRLLDRTNCQVILDPAVVMLPNLSVGFPKRRPSLHELRMKSDQESSLIDAYLEQKMNWWVKLNEALQKSDANERIKYAGSTMTLELSNEGSITGLEISPSNRKKKHYLETIFLELQLQPFVFESDSITKLRVELVINDETEQQFEDFHAKVEDLMEFPSRARSEGTNGTASVSLEVDYDGNIRKMNFLKFTDRIFADELARCIWGASSFLPRKPGNYLLQSKFVIGWNDEDLSYDLVENFKGIRLPSVVIKGTEKSESNLTVAHQYVELLLNPHAKPSFPGGVKSLDLFVDVNRRKLEKNNRLPVNDNFDKVTVTMTVNSQGEIENPYISKGLGPVFNEEALRIVSLMPMWIPGKVSDVPKDMEVIYEIPFSSLSVHEYENVKSKIREAKTKIAQSKYSQAFSLIEEGLKINHYCLDLFELIIELKSVKQNRQCELLKSAVEYDQDLKNWYLDNCK